MTSSQWLVTNFTCLETFDYEKNDNNKLSKMLFGNWFFLNNWLVCLKQKILTYNHILSIILFDFKGILSNQSLLEPIRHIPFKGKQKCIQSHFGALHFHNQQISYSLILPVIECPWWQKELRVLLHRCLQTLNQLDFQFIKPPLATQNL